MSAWNRERMTPTEKSIITSEKDNHVSITLSLAVYPLEKVFAAARDYSETCWANTASSSASSVTVTLTPKTPVGIPLETLGREFCNYLLG